MLVYWKKETKHVEKYDTYGNPMYFTEELFGKIVGAFSNEGGTGRNMLVVAMNNGDFKTIPLDKCYHKTNINEG